MRDLVEQVVHLRLVGGVGNVSARRVSFRLDQRYNLVQFRPGPSRHENMQAQTRKAFTQLCSQTVFRPYPYDDCSLHGQFPVPVFGYWRLNIKSYVSNGKVTNGIFRFFARLRYSSNTPR